MTARLPTPGGDSGTWGDVLNGYLAVGHDASGHNIGTGTFSTDVTVIGPELISNPLFLGNSTGWTLNANTWSSGQISATYSGSNNTHLTTPVALIAGHYYLVKINLTISGDLISAALDSDAVWVLGSGSPTVQNIILVADATSTDQLDIDFYNDNVGATRAITSISMKEITPPVPSLNIEDFGGNTILSLGNNTFNNVALGNGALSSNTTGTVNVAIGDGALHFNTTGSPNIAVGEGALYYTTTGTDNIAVGCDASYLNTTGIFNFSFGTFALYTNTTGNHNIAFGVQSLFNSTTGSGNTVIGHNAGGSVITGSNNILIGGVDTPGDQSNYLNIGGAIKGQMDTGPLTISTPCYIIPPTSDPHVVGALWNNSGTLTISAG
jgi:hypothetical protein